MKKLVVLSLVLCLVSGLSAQIRYGVKGGANFSNLYVNGDRSGMNAEQYKGRFSYHFGGMLEYSLSDMFSIQPELLYMNQGANLKGDNSFLVDKGHVTLNTLQLPVNLKATFGSGKSKLFVYGGPYVGYHIYGKATGKVDGVATDISLFGKGSSMERFDYGVGLGVGVERDGFVVSLGNQIGKADISGAKGSKMKTGSLTVSVGYFF